MSKKYEILVDKRKIVEATASDDKEIEIAEKLVEMVRNKYGVRAKIRKLSE